MTFNKRIIAAVIAAITLITICTASFAVNAVENQKIGDVDGDGKINIKDATTIQKVIAKLAEEPENYNDVADVNLDKFVDIKDVTVIQKYLAKFYNELPYKTDETEPATQQTTADVTGVTEKPTEETATADPGKPTDPVNPTDPEVTEPTSTQQATTVPVTQPETDEEGWGNKIYQP